MELGLLRAANLLDPPQHQAVLRPGERHVEQAALLRRLLGHGPRPCGRRGRARPHRPGGAAARRAGPVRGRGIRGCPASGGGRPTGRAPAPPGIRAPWRRGSSVPAPRRRPVSRRRWRDSGSSTLSSAFRAASSMAASSHTTSDPSRPRRHTACISSATWARSVSIRSPPGSASTLAARRVVRSTSPSRAGTPRSYSRVRQPMKRCCQARAFSSWRAAASSRCRPASGVTAAIRT